MNKVRAPDKDIKEQVLCEYKKGIGPKALAEKTGISINTIKSWIGRDKVKIKKELQDATKSKDAPVKKRGAPVGNANAVGHGAPKRNRNAVKHGGYATIYWDTLTEEEQEMIEDIPDEEESLLIEQIQLFSIRERRLMQAIKKYMEKDQYISGTMESEDDRKFTDQQEEELYRKEIEKRVQNGERLPGKPYSIQTNKGATIDLISRLEKELTSVQSKKTKAIETLSHLRLEKQKLTGETKGNEAVRIWAEKIKEMRKTGGQYE